MSNLYQGLLPHIIYPSTVADEQARLLASGQGTDQTVQACTTLDTPTKQSWGLFYGALVGFCSESPGFFGLGGMMDRAQKYEDELVGWQQLLATKNCSLTVPIYQPKDPPNDLTTALQYVAWITGAIGGAYVVGKIVSVIPRRSS